MWGEGIGEGGHFRGPRALNAEGSACCNGALPEKYLALMRNYSTGSHPDALALWLDGATVYQDSNFIGFFGTDPATSKGRLLGEIEADGNAGSPTSSSPW
jgi:hypothetical protein